MFTLDRDLIIFDVETTGISDESSIIQLGAIRFSKRGKLVHEERFNQYVIPYTDEWDEKAFKVHNITEEYLHKHGEEIDVVLKNFTKWIYDNTSRNVYLAQWSCGFDVRMLQKAFESVDKKFPFTHRAYDIASIVRFYLATCGQDTSRGLTDCANYLKIDLSEFKAHNALDDAIVTGLCLEKTIEEINNNVNKYKTADNKKNNSSK